MKLPNWRLMLEIAKTAFMIIAVLIGDMIVKLTYLVWRKLKAGRT